MNNCDTKSCPEAFVFTGQLVNVLKYGENGWQTPAGLYREQEEDSDPLALTQFTLLEGAELGFVNWADVDRLLQTMTHIVAAFDQNFGSSLHTAVGVKHGNACGAAVGSDVVKVTRKMMEGDPRSIFGGYVMVNYPVDMGVAEAILDVLDGKPILAGIVAPDITEEAKRMLRRKGNRHQFLTNPALATLSKESLDTRLRVRTVRGGFLVQPNYAFVPQQPCDEQSGITVLGATHVPAPVWQDVLLAWAVGSTSNSNTITLVKDHQLIGNGVGQQSRVDAAELAIVRARNSRHDVRGAVAYSDSFFPFPDAPDALINAGIRAIFTSSGSVGDQEVTDLCSQRGVTLIMIPDAAGRGFFGH